MRAITLWEPWATAIAIGAKTIETRGWKTDFRGMLAIHAAKTKDNSLFVQRLDVAEIFLQHGIRGVGDLSFGCVVATCCVVDCLPTEVLLRRGIGALELQLGDYSPRRFGWVLGDVVKLANPVPARGGQRFWTWTPENDSNQKCEAKK